VLLGPTGKKETAELYPAKLAESSFNCNLDARVILFEPCKNFGKKIRADGNAGAGTRFLNGKTSQIVDPCF